MKVEQAYIPQTLVEDLQETMHLDLVAYFKMLEQETMDIVAQGVKEGWTPDEIIAEVDRFIAGDSTAQASEIPYPGSRVAKSEGGSCLNQENQVSRSTVMKALACSLETLVAIKAARPVGAISERRDGKYKKYGPGDWRKITDEGRQADDDKSKDAPMASITIANKDRDYGSWGEWAKRGEKGRQEDTAEAVKEYKSIIENHYGGAQLKKETSLHQQQAIANYTSDQYKKINEAAKNGPKTKEEAETIAGLDEYIKEVPLPVDMLFYRGIAADVKWETGQVIGVNGFCSMTTDTNTARRFALQKSAAAGSQEKAKGTLMRIVARKGSPIAPTDGMGTYKDKEAEFIGARDMKMRVVSYKEEGGRRVYEMEVV